MRNHEDVSFAHDDTITHAVDIAARSEDIFHMIAHPSGMVQAFPLLAVDAVMKVGGSISLKGENAGEPFTDTGTILAFDSPTHFAYRYTSTNHEVSHDGPREVLLSYTIEQAGDACRLTVRQSNLPS